MNDHLVIISNTMYNYMSHTVWRSVVSLPIIDHTVCTQKVGEFYVSRLVMCHDRIPDYLYRFHSLHTEQLCMLFCSLLMFFKIIFFSENQLFRKIILGMPSECQTVWIQIRPSGSKLESLSAEKVYQQANS